ncbi:MAG: histidinol-phosphatase [Ponticaulis sp.]|nr:histidinol-phosphatase [Ponticaulis sp.]|tara:strand:+ start:5608 stop:6459 length:852 start_codon:yes stop_codon:yes gene_type:complete
MSISFTPISELTKDFQDRLKLAERLGDAARAITLPLFRNHGLTDNKLGDAGFDPVTKADRDAEEAMREILDKEAPDDAVNGEEFGLKDGTSGWTWYLDPVDGTRAFIAGLPSWTTLIACALGDTPEIGLIDQPWLDERYVGWTRGAVSHIRGETRQLTVDPETRLTNAILSTTDPFILTPSERGAFEHLRQTARLTRYGLDAYAYARVAAGDMHIVTETSLQPHDVGALIPVIRGAGGVACDWSGQPAKLGPQLVCAATQEIMDQAVVSLRRSAGGRSRIGLD